MKSMVCLKSSFRLVSFFHADIVKSPADIVKSPADIEFSEVLSPLKFVDEFRDEAKGVLVLHCDCIQHSVILHKSK